MRAAEMGAIVCWSTISEDDALVLLTPFNDVWIDGRPTRAMSMKERLDQRLVWLVTRASKCDRFSSQDRRTTAQAWRSQWAPTPFPPTACRGSLLRWQQRIPGGRPLRQQSLSVAEILASGGWRANDVWLSCAAGLAASQRTQDLPPARTIFVSNSN